MSNRRSPFLFVLSALTLSFTACTTPPAPAPPPPVRAAPAPLPPEVIPQGVQVSPPKTGDVSAAFSADKVGQNTFPANLIGARLMFSSNLKMPKLEAVVTGPDRFRLFIRFSNPSKKPLLVSLVCTYADDASSARKVRNLSFPVSTYRDIAIDFNGQPERTLLIRANAEEAH